MIQNQDSEIERRSHPENFLPDGILDDDIADWVAYGSAKDWEESENE